MQIFTHVSVHGSHEALSELVMAMRQALDVAAAPGAGGPMYRCLTGAAPKVLSKAAFGSAVRQDAAAQPSEDGSRLVLTKIVDLDSFSRMTGNFLTEGAPDELLKTITHAHPQVVVWAYSLPWTGRPTAPEFAQLWADGEVCHAPAPPTEDSDHVRTLFQQAADALASKALAGRHAARRPSSHGWPRWSLLSHSANSGAIGDLAEAAAAAGGASATEMAQALLADNRAGRAAGVASWLDTLMFGDAASAPELTLDAQSWAPRQRVVLEFISSNLAPQASHHAFSCALVHALGDLSTRLQHGLHPIAFLSTTALASAESASPQDLKPALEAIVGSFAARAAATQSAASATDMPLRASTIGAALTCKGRLGTNAAAVRSGADPAALLRSIDDGVDLLFSFRDAYGSYGAFPATLVDEVHRRGGDFKAVYTALLAQEAMQAGIGTALAPAAAAQARERGRHRALK